MSRIAIVGVIIAIAAAVPGCGEESNKAGGEAIGRNGRLDAREPCRQPHRP